MKVMYHLLNIIDPKEEPCLNLLLLDHQHMKTELDVHHMPLTYNNNNNNKRPKTTISKFIRRDPVRECSRREFEDLSI